ncbi:MAG: Extracellular ligand-binding receptor [Clostridia bacterium]|jgi:branched-chain amino acid transport system substrate-binding protein|nr:Extracellular ligand-binding receptor [Clostridia bacterium]
MKKMAVKKLTALLLSLALVFSSFIGVAADGTQGATATEIKVGTVAVQSGVLSFIGTPYVAGMKAYFDLVNAGGGVNGRKIKLIVKDDEFKTDKAIAAVESLIEVEKVFAIVGQLGTPGVKATSITVKEAGIPSVYFGTGEDSVTRMGENFFPVQPSYVNEGKIMAQYVAKTAKAKKIVVLYQNDAVGRQGLSGIEAGLKTMKLTSLLPSNGKIAFGAADKDFTAQVQKAKALKPDFIIIYGLSGATAGILKEIEKVNYNVPMLTTYSNADASFLTIAAAGAPNVLKNLQVLGWLEVNESKMKPFMDAMKKYEPQAPVNAYTMAGWVAAETFVAGLKSAGKYLTWETYIAGMNKLNFTTGLAPQIKYTKGVREGVKKMAVSKAVLGKDGKYSFELLTKFFEFTGK